MYVEDRLAVTESLAEDQILRFGILCVRPEAILMRGIPFVQDSPVEEQVVVGRDHLVNGQSRQQGVAERVVSIPLHQGRHSLAQSGRATRLLEELGAKPKVFYLQKVK